MSSEVVGLGFSFIRWMQGTPSLPMPTFPAAFSQQSQKIQCMAQKSFHRSVKNYSQKVIPREFDECFTYIIV